MNAVPVSRNEKKRMILSLVSAVVAFAVSDLVIGPAVFHGSVGYCSLMIALVVFVAVAVISGQVLKEKTR